MLHLYGIGHAHQTLELFVMPSQKDGVLMESDPTSCTGCANCFTLTQAMVCPNAPQVCGPALLLMHFRLASLRCQVRALWGTADG